MDERLFRHLNMPPELAVEFLCVFSRLEYALKSTVFADGGPNRVDASWDRFANYIHEEFVALDYEKLKNAAKFLLTEPPRKQVLLNNQLSFIDQHIDDRQRSTQQLLKMVRTVRNNLFHGGKYCPQGEKEQGRNQQLIEASLEVLRYCRILHQEVSASYER